MSLPLPERIDMTGYIVTTPKNPQYDGKCYGVTFQHGRAFVSEHTIDPSLGWTVEQVVDRMRKDFGYAVERVREEAAPRTSGKRRGRAGAKVAPEVSDEET